MPRHPVRQLDRAYLVPSGAIHNMLQCKTVHRSRSICRTMASAAVSIAGLGGDVRGHRDLTEGLRQIGMVLGQGLGRRTHPAWRGGYARPPKPPAARHRRSAGRGPALMIQAPCGSTPRVRDIQDMPGAIGVRGRIRIRICAPGPTAASRPSAGRHGRRYRPDLLWRARPAMDRKAQSRQLGPRGRRPVRQGPRMPDRGLACQRRGPFLPYPRRADWPLGPVDVQQVSHRVADEILAHGVGHAGLDHAAERHVIGPTDLAKHRLDARPGVENGPQARIGGKLSQPAVQVVDEVIHGPRGLPRYPGFRSRPLAAMARSISMASRACSSAPTDNPTILCSGIALPVAAIALPGADICGQFDVRCMSPPGDVAAFCGSPISFGAHGRSGPGQRPAAAPASPSRHN